VRLDHYLEKIWDRAFAKCRSLKRLGGLSMNDVENIAEEYGVDADILASFELKAEPDKKDTP
jgi:hypothetical protein